MRQFIGNASATWKRPHSLARRACMWPACMCRSEAHPAGRALRLACSQTYSPAGALVRRICGALIFLALVLGGPTITVGAGVADGMSAHGMNEPMSENCPECDGDNAQMRSCAQTMFAALSGILPAGDVPLFGAQLPFVEGPDQILAEMSRLPEPKPPRLIVLG